LPWPPRCPRHRAVAGAGGGATVGPRSPESDRADPFMSAGVGLRFFVSEGADVRVEYLFRHVLGEAERYQLHEVIADVTIFVERKRENPNRSR